MFSSFSKWTVTHITKITLVLCGLSTLSLALYFILDNRLISVLDVLPVYFGFLKMDWTLLYVEMPSGTYLALDILRLFLIAAMIIGAVIYKQSKGKERKLLYFSYAIVFMSSIFNMVGFIFRRVFESDFDVIYSFLSREKYDYHWVLEIFTVLTWLFLILISYSILKQWKSETKLISNEKETDTISNPSSNWKRLFHFLFDLFIFLCITSDFIQELLNLIKHKLNLSSHFDDIGVPLLLILFTVIYYTVFESTFHITPAKILSHSKLISTNKNKLTFSKAIGRSFARHIPFNPISFLFHNGWHDVLTNTGVVDVEEKTSYVLVYWLLFILLIICLVVNYILNPFS